MTEEPAVVHASTRPRSVDPTKGRELTVGSGDAGGIVALVPTSTPGAHAWLMDRTSTGFGPPEEFRRAHVWIERNGQRMERLLLVAERSDLDVLDHWHPERVGYQIATRRHHVPVRRPAAILALWPDRELLERAIAKGEGGALCVVAGPGGDDERWPASLTVDDLAESRYDVPQRLDVAVRAVIDDIARAEFGDQLADSASRVAMVRAFRRLRAEGHRPSPDDVEAYAQLAAIVNHRGARRIRQAYEAAAGGEPLSVHGRKI